MYVYIYINSNLTKSSLRGWKMLKLQQILFEKKKKNSQTNVARIWLVKLKQYMMFESIFFLIADMSISKAYAVEFVVSLASLKVN